MTKIAVIIGSTRPGRRSRAVAEWVMEAGKRQDAVADGKASLELVDIADYELPLLDERLPALFGQYENAHTKRWAAKIGSFDGFVFVTPEYNHSIPAALKNAIDYLFAEWNNKAAGFVSYGARSGTCAVEHLRACMGELKVADVRTQVALSLFTDFQLTNPAETGTFAPAPQHEPALHTLLEEVISWSQALSGLRTPAAGE